MTTTTTLRRMKVMLQFCSLWLFLFACLQLPYASHAASTPTVFPTLQPTYRPTSVPTAAAPPTATALQATGIIAQHQLVVVEPSGNSVIKLKFYDTTTTDFKFAIQTLPATGSLYQLSQVYSNYGYEPKFGTMITNTGGQETVVTGSNNRVYYTRPKPDVANNQMVSSLYYYI